MHHLVFPQRDQAERARTQKLQDLSKKVTPKTKTALDDEGSAGESAQDDESEEEMGMDSDSELEEASDGDEDEDEDDEESEEEEVPKVRAHLGEGRPVRI